ncbi:MAG: hypothetical protein P9M03_03200 [Candidatus Theseobacter exili]|nr:hypothetical protein [Candidatus Theseobacter exili]
MWKFWMGLIFCSVMWIACFISTCHDWYKRKTGPFGPKPIDWWGALVFGIIMTLIIIWCARKIFF